MTRAHAPQSAEIDEFRLQVREWIAANRPAAPPFMLPQSFLEVETRDQFEYLRDWQRALYDAGYVGFDVPREYGGQGVDPARHAVVKGELGRAGAPFLVNRIALDWVAPTLLTYGSEAQKKRLLGPLLSAEEIWCQGFSEPGAGSDLASLQARAVKDPDGTGYRVSGHKVWTTLAHFSKWMILLARTDSEASKYAGLSYFLFPMDSPGITVEPLVKMTGEGGFNQVLFDDAPMPADSLLGAEGQGWKIAMTTLTFERGAAQGGDGERSAGEAELFGRIVALARRTVRDGRTVAEDPLFCDRLAELWIELEAMRAGGRRAGVAGLCSDHPNALSMMHKLLFSEWGQRVHQLACEMLGPEAHLWLDDENAVDGAEWARGYMNSYGFTIGGGTSEIQRNIIGERVLGLPKSK
ncbi:MAG: acyl-CoA dehydrogenase family protein [Myxococcota bacterium]